MKSDEIAVGGSGVSILGFPLGFEPSIRDFELALEGKTLRQTHTSSPDRVLWICDAKGLSWMADLERGTVAWLDIALGPLRHRPVSESDPQGLFAGKVRIGRYTVIGEFSVETGEVIRNITVPGLTIDLSAAAVVLEE